MLLHICTERFQHFGRKFLGLPTLTTALKAIHMICSHPAFELHVSVIRVFIDSVFRSLSDQHRPLFINAHRRRRNVRIRVVFDDFRAHALEHRDGAVRGPEVDSKVNSGSHRVDCDDIGVAITTSPC